MAEPPVEFKPNIDDPEIAQPHIVEPPEAVKVNTANYFLHLKSIRFEMT
jgi:hypothetical protein